MNKKERKSTKRLKKLKKINHPKISCISSVVSWYVLKPKCNYSLFMWPAILFQPKQSSSTFPSFRLSRLSTSYLSSQIAAFSHNIYAVTDRGRTVHLKHV